MGLLCAVATEWIGDGARVRVRCRWRSRISRNRPTVGILSPSESVVNSPLPFKILSLYGNEGQRTLIAQQQLITIPRRRFVIYQLSDNSIDQRVSKSRHCTWCRHFDSRRNDEENQGGREGCGQTLPGAPKAAQAFVIYFTISMWSSA